MITSCRQEALAASADHFLLKADACDSSRDAIISLFSTGNS